MWLKNNVIYLLLTLFLIAGCQDVIDVELDPAPARLVVDAWLNDKPEAQLIRLTQSTPYLDASPVPAVSGAEVVITSDDDRTLIFTDEGNGNYRWTPEDGQNIGPVGTTFTLNIIWNNTPYTATSVMRPVPAIDSITQEFRVDELVGPDGIYAQFFARDLLGLGNAYWIKTFKNGIFLNKPQELNIAFDAGFDPGAELDGLIFIPPIRELVNRIPDQDNPEDDDNVPPWAAGDTILVEIHSLNVPAFAFLDIARDQMTNGDNTIFAIPLANAKGNIVSAGGDEVLGIFNVAAVSMMQKVIEE